jgi:glucosamine--fructose-6-phosphate aminotransferase (isomerizing)
VNRSSIAGAGKPGWAVRPLVATVPLQVFARELATARGNEVDQPRNLVESVAVE